MYASFYITDGQIVLNFTQNYGIVSKLKAKKWLSFRVDELVQLRGIRLLNIFRFELA